LPKEISGRGLNLGVDGVCDRPVIDKTFMFCLKAGGGVTVGGGGSIVFPNK